MHVDTRELPDDQQIQVDVCIVGAGAAGITLALELAGTHHSVALLESGGFETDASTQELYAGGNVGHPYYALIATRLRFFGGSTNHWAGWCRPLDTEDFEKRSWVPNSGWPIKRAELDPYYERAHSLCNLGPFRYDATSWSAAQGGDRTPLPPDTAKTEIFQFSPPTRFGSVYRDDIGKASNITTYLWANLLEFESDPETGRIRRARAGTLSGKRFDIVAKQYVLAAGGLENARLLLASRSASASGVGNQHDVVGRYFMDHPHLQHGTFLPSDPKLDLSFYKSHTVADTKILGILVLDQKIRAQHQILGFSTTFVDSWIPTLSKGPPSFRLLYREIKQGQLPDDFGSHLWNVISEIDDVAADRYRRYRKTPMKEATYVLDTRAEQVPNPSSRVTLSDETDALGIPRIDLDWQLTEQDEHTLRAGQKLIADQMAKAGLGRTQLPDEDDSEWMEYVVGGSHHMGTTRMSEAPRNGVVDRHCQVHGVGNLYIAGSSVFATCGYANPTLTIVALAARMGDRLKEVLS